MIATVIIHVHIAVDRDDQIGDELQKSLRQKLLRRLKMQHRRKLLRRSKIPRMSRPQKQSLNLRKNCLSSPRSLWRSLNLRHRR